MNIRKALPTYILLFFIPAVFGLFLYLRILSIDKAHEIEDIKFKLSERAVDFIAQANPVDYFQPHFQKLAGQLFPYIEGNASENGKLMTSQDASNAIASLSNQLQENVRCALFNDNGELLNPQDLLDYEVRFYSFAWKNIHKISDCDYVGRRADQVIILGRDFNDDKMQGFSERCLPTQSLGKNGVFYFKNAKKHLNGIIIFVEYKHTNLELIQAKIKDAATIDQPIILYDRESKKRLTPTLGHKEYPYSQTDTEEFLEGFISEDLVWKGFKSDDYKLLFGEKLKDASQYTINIYLGIIAFILILTTATVFFFKSISVAQGIHISIRYKLIFIFIIAVYMPTLGIWVLSKTSLHDHRIAIENEIKKGMLDILSKLDQEYDNSIKEAHNCYLELDKYIKSFKGKAAPSPIEFEIKLKEIVGKERNITDVFNWFDARTIDLKQIYTTSNSESQNRLEKIGRYLSVLCIQKYIPDRFSRAGVKLNQSDILVGNLMENPIVGFSSVFERPREYTYQAFEGSSIYWWWDYIPDDDNPFALFIGNSAERYLSRTYFKSLLKNRYTFENTSLKIADFYYVGQEFIPETASKYPDVMELINASNLSKTVETQTINYENNQYLCLCYPGSKMLDNYLLCMYPTTEIDYKIEKVRSTIYTVMIILLIISILTGLLLSKTFITPVNELDRGLNALRKRETETKIKIDSKDELGQLGTAFNQMMAEIKDMLLAGAIQQCLIPVGKYKLEGYDCQVYNQMALDVGGDYADIFQLPNERILIVIGDVTGHGVSSALLTAMVKASVFRFAQKDTPLTEITTQTSNMICDLLNKKKLMTFCAVTLDTNTGEMAICNAGHPMPMIHSEKGVLRTPAKHALPLGVSKKRCRYTSETEVLQPGETLFLYTDGFPEAENANGEEYTYEKFQELVTNQEINSAEGFKNLLLKEFKQHHGDTELADDVTFIILRRLKSEPI